MSPCSAQTPATAEAAPYVAHPDALPLRTSLRARGFGTFWTYRRCPHCLLSLRLLVDRHGRPVAPAA